MFLYLQDIYSFINSNPMYYDTFMEKIVYPKEKESEDESRYIQLPLISDKEIYISYLNQYYDKRVKKNILNYVDDKDFANIFHHFLHDYNVVNEFSIFENNMLLRIAEEWCQNNNIKYTKKPSYQKGNNETLQDGLIREVKELTRVLDREESRNRTLRNKN